MLVKSRRSGKLGYIPDDKFDPNLFEQASGGSQTNIEPQMQESLSSKVGGGLMDILSGMAKPFVNTGKRIGAAGYELGRGGVSSVASLFEKSNPELAQKLYQAASAENPLAKTEEDINKLSDPLKIAKDSAGILAWAVPGGGFTQGLKSGALTGFSQSGDTIEEILGSTALGGLTGGVTSKVLSKVLGTGKGLQKAGQKMQEGFVEEAVEGTPKYASNVKRLVGVQNKLNLTGSVRNKLDQVDDAFTRVEIDIKDKLAKLPGVSKRTALEDFSNELVKTNYLGSKSVYKEAVNAYTKRLGQAVKGGSGKALYDLKSELRGELQTALKALGKGNAKLSPTEEVKYALYKSLKKTIDRVDDSIRPLNQLEHDMFDLSLGLYKAKDEGGVTLPFLGKIGQSQTQASRDIISRGEQKTGTVLDSVLGLVPPSTATKAGSIYGAAGITQPGIQVPTGDIEQQQIAPDITSQAPMEQASGEFKITPEMLLTARLTLGDKKFQQLKEIYDLQRGDTSATTTKRRQAVSSAEQIYKQVEGLALQAPSGVGGWFQALTGQLPGIEGGSAEDLKRVTEGFAKAIAGAFAGEVGVATDQDVQRWLGLMPKPGDTQAERVRALQRLKETIEVEKSKFGL